MNSYIRIDKYGGLVYKREHDLEDTYVQNGEEFMQDLGYSEDTLDELLECLEKAY